MLVLTSKAKLLIDISFFVKPRSVLPTAFIVSLFLILLLVLFDGGDFHDQLVHIFSQQRMEAFSLNSVHAVWLASHIIFSSYQYVRKCWFLFLSFLLSLQVAGWSKRNLTQVAVSSYIVKVFSDPQSHRLFLLLQWPHSIVFC